MVLAASADRAWRQKTKAPDPGRLFLWGDCIARQTRHHFLSRRPRLRRSRAAVRRLWRVCRPAGELHDSRYAQQHEFRRSRRSAVGWAERTALHATGETPRWRARADQRRGWQHRSACRADRQVHGRGSHGSRQRAQRGPRASYRRGSLRRLYEAGFRGQRTDV